MGSVAGKGMGSGTQAGRLALERHVESSSIMAIEPEGKRADGGE